MIARTGFVPKSIAGQLALLTFVFALLTVAYLAVPFWQHFSTTDAIGRTLWIAETEMRTAVSSNVAEGGIAEFLEGSEDIGEILALNAEFRYFVDRNGEQVRFGAEPRWRDAIKFDHVGVPTGSLGNPVDCSTSSWWRATDDENGVAVVIGYYSCGPEYTYYEFSGISEPTERASRLFDVESLKIFWIGSRNVLLGIFGIAIIGFLVIWATTKSLRRLILVADSFDEGSVEHVLPTEGLPREIVPLVRAVNKMMHRIDESNRKRAFFLATAAHEMRTPMAILRNRLERLPDGDDKEDLRSDIRRISGLLEQLLQLLRIGDSQVDSSEVDLTEVTKDVIIDRAPVALRQGVDVELVTDAEPTPITGDQQLLQIAISNLIDNAISFSSGGNSVTVRVGSDKRVTVSDEGPGISEELFDDLFEPFAKSPPNRDGHGLGLAIVKAITTLHNGTVFAENEPDRGAKFVLQF